MKNHDAPEAPKLKRWGLIIWPAFLAACLLEALVFSMIDPGEIHWPGLDMQASRRGVYTVAFFLFWLIGVVSNGLVLWLAQPDPRDQ